MVPRTIVLALATVLFAGPAGAKIHMYGGNLVGIAGLGESTWTASDGTSASVTYMGGPTLGGFFGVEVVKNLRVEGELVFSHNLVDSVGTSGGGSAGSGDTGIISWMGNGFYDFRITERWNLYAGGGLGVASVFLNGISSQEPAINFVGADGADTAFAWQVGAGVEFHVSSILALRIDYRFFRTSELSYTADDGTGFTTHIRRKTIRLGTRWMF